MAGEIHMSAQFNEGFFVAQIDDVVPYLDGNNRATKGSLVYCERSGRGDGLVSVLFCSRGGFEVEGLFWHRIVEENSMNGGFP